MTAARQLADDLHARIVMPTAALLGADLVEVLAGRAEQAAPRLVAQLAAREGEAAGTAGDVLTALWGEGDPDPAWWSTPLGRLVAGAISDDGGERVTQAVAAAMLGVTKGTVAQLVHRGTLDRHPDGGVLRASVLQRIASRAANDG